MTTLRQIAANRANAALSTGPRTEAGKEISRANALKHGLAGAGLVLPDEQREAVQERVAQWHSSVHPFENVDVWLLEVIAVESIRVERCRDHEADARDRLARRAEHLWDDDRRLAAVTLAAGLSRRPDVVAVQLLQTAQGVDLCIERWEALGRSAATNGDWTEPQRSLALDLLGVPRVLRDAPTRLDPPDGVVRADWLAGLVAERVADLRERRLALAGHDGREQASAMLGVGPDDAEITRLHRYERACMRRLEWAFGLIRNRRRSPLPSSSTFPRPAPPPVPYDRPPSSSSEVHPGPRLSDAVAVGTTPEAGADDAPAPASPVPSASRPARAAPSRRQRQARAALLVC